MSQTKIASLTIEQEVLLPVYRDKWRDRSFSCQPINREKAARAVKTTYAALGLPEPDIVFLTSPDALRQMLLQQSPKALAQQWGAPLLASLGTAIGDRVREQVENSLWIDLESELSPEDFPLMMFALQDTLVGQDGELLTQLWGEWQEGIWRQMWERQEREMRQELLKIPGMEPLTQVGDFLWQHIGEPLSQQLEETFWKPMANEPWVRELERQMTQPLLQLVGGMGFVWNLARNLQAGSVATLDFCISVLGCDCDRAEWEAYMGLATECGLTLPLENACLVCDRPIELSFDSDRRLHAEGKAAIAWADGYRIYAFQGVRLPPRYGRLHPNLWRSEWLLTEPNAELRRVLIQGIGYSRICQELDATELDFWREYTLLRIENEVDIEPIHLLKMTCPSTDYIHATRVPPHIFSAREAIRWVNWDIDPEQFVVES